MPICLTISKYIYAAWLFSIPFYLYSLIGTLSLDNILTPIAFVSSVCRLFFTIEPLPRDKPKVLVIFFIIFWIYASGRLLSVISNMNYFSFTCHLILKQFAYFAIPMVYINSEKDVQFTSRLIVIIAVVGIFSALLASLGLCNFPVERYAESRIGIASLRKAIGLFTNFGDMAILGSYALLYLYHGRSQKRNLSRKLMAFLAAIMIMAGYVGAQSRNMYLTLIVAAGFTVYFRIAVRKGVFTSIFLAVAATLAGLGVAASLNLFDVSTLASLKGFGGTREAAATVDARLWQYALAWDLFIHYPWVGNAIGIMDAGIEIHNLWLATMALGGLVSTTALVLMFLIAFGTLAAKPCCTELSRCKVFGLAQLVSVFVAAEFYGAMTYVFLIAMGTLAMFPVVLVQNKDRERDESA